MLPVAVARSPSDGNSICYELPVLWMKSCFHSHNEWNKPESKTTHMFSPVRQVAAPVAKSAVSDCILFKLRISFIARPVEHQLHRISKALTKPDMPSHGTIKAMGTRTADSTQVYITYYGWNIKVLFLTL